MCVASYHDYLHQGEIKVLKPVAPSIAAIGNGKGKGVLLIDDLTDTGKTAKLVREMLPDAHFATVYAKPAGAPHVPHVHNRGVAGHVDLFPLGPGSAIRGADQRRKGEGKLRFTARVRSSFDRPGQGWSARRRFVQLSGTVHTSG